MPTGNWWFQDAQTGVPADLTVWFNTDGTWQVQTPENYWTRSYFQTAPLHDSREFDYVYEPIDISALKSTLGWLRYDENGNLIFEDPQQEPDICLTKEVMEEVL